MLDCRNMCFWIRGISDFSFSQSGCSWRFSDGRCILLLVRLILWGTAAYVNLPPIEVVPLSINGKIVLVAIDNRRLACFVIAQIQLGNNRTVSVPVKFTCINELCGRRLRRYRRTAMLGIRPQIRIRGHRSSLIVSIQRHWRVVNHCGNRRYHRGHSRHRGCAFANQQTL